jgi:hypothetical protein
MPAQTKIQIRRDTAANWTSTNPTLAAGELGLETNTGKIKAGDGSAAWTALGYVNPAGTATPVTTSAHITAVYSNATTTLTQVVGYTQLANTAIVGETYRIRAFGYRSGTGNSNATFEIRVDGVSTLSFTHAATATAAGFNIEAYVTIMTTGATGTARTQGMSAYNSTLQTSNVNVSSTISTTSDSVIELRLSSANPTNTYFVTNATIEMLN